MPDCETPIVTIDVAALTLVERELSVALAIRAAPPYEGDTALIGGYVHVDEDADAEATAARVLREKAALDGVYIEQLMTFSGATRDPRGWSASIAYMALLPVDLLRNSPAGMAIRPVAQVSGLPFDHDRILAAAVARLRGKGAYSTLPARLLGERFSLGELHDTYEAVRGERIDPSAFRRKILELDVLEEISGEKFMAGPSRRPAQLYRLRPGTGLFDRRI